MSDRPLGGRLRVATYNLRNLFLGTANDVLAAQRRARPKKRRELKAIARTLDALDADVLALQEVGGGEALAAVNALCPRPYEHLAVVEGNSDRGIHLAYLSRLPMQLTSHASAPLLAADDSPLRDYLRADDVEKEQLTALRLQRDLLRCDLQGASLVLFNAHFKSPNQSRWRRLSADELRAAEARLVGRIVTEQLAREPERPVCLLGDFNAAWDSESLAPLKAIGLERVPSAPEPASFWPGGVTVDHVLVNAAARRGLQGPALVSDGGPARKGSDHYPVSVCLALD